MKNCFNYILLFVLLTGSTINTFGQNRYLHMTGTIGANDPVTADLIISGGRVDGFYNNNNYGQRISIAVSGELQAGGNMVINEKSSDRLLFTGNFTGGNRITGMWEKSDQNEKFPFELNEVYSGGSAPYRLYSVHSKTSLSGSKDSPIALFQASVLLPPDTMNKKIAMNINSAVFSRFFGTTRTQNPETLIKDLETRYFNLYKTNNTGINTAGNYQFLNWEKRKTMLVMFNENYITTMNFRDYAYTGGDFSLDIEKFLVFDIRTGRDLKLADIFAPGFYDKIGLIITNRIKENLKIDNSESLSNYGFFADKAEPTENFYVNTAGIGFHYNTYEIAGKETGPQVVFIPFSELKPLLSSNHPFEWLR